ncbi:hypothetical protein ABB37_05845 [Leptomonas pyrrhocoris]|uniref:Uncharacterized protein n=1 Tax=Leptomonas pyrrhocoris TaxID=157538 RepID=A0A0M9FYI9_LEPPY|nr:hypothetical protein ABB37_05845 [Leptomonas pyrrhocoris]XP_015657154.1 hypothetical protein ABB37_05845 [Leptomonas pyrrhocoris]KPA78714.1 hypothetical protein ABB37_05845 [Leptomonas pyrrhocoris]KPA78715.1 hypothetical protein ABB37_05845 [Leptomonas pyrrhocoris]|eukprot:XP_015657153.1 hypothetical protein ABB37_05845 [Leptomonas pyrrhocoris]
MGNTVTRSTIVVRGRGDDRPRPAKQRAKQHRHPSPATTSGSTASPQAHRRKRSEKHRNNSAATQPTEAVPAQLKPRDGSLPADDTFSFPVTDLAAKEATRPNEQASPASILGESCVAGYSPFDSPITQQHNTRGPDEASTEPITKKFPAVNTNVVVLETHTSSHTRKAGATHPHTDSLLLSANDGEGDQWPYPIYMGHGDIEPQMQITRPTAQGHDAVKLIEPKTAADDLTHQTQQPEQQQLPESMDRTTMAGGRKGTSAAMLPFSAVAWRTPPAPPLPSSQPHDHHTQQQPPESSPAPLSTVVAVPASAIEVAARPPPSPAAVDANSAIRKARQTTPVSPQSSAGGDAHGHRKRVLRQPHVTEEQRPPSSPRSIGGSLELREDREPPPPIVSTSHRAAAQFEEEFDLVASRSSAPPPATSPLRPTKESGPEDAATAVKGESNAPRTPPRSVASATHRTTDRSLVASAANWIFEYSATPRDKIQSYGSFMSDCREDMNPPTSTVSAVFDARATSVAPTVEVQPATSQAPSSAKPRTPPADVPYFSMVRDGRRKDESESQGTERKKAVAKERPAGSILDTSLIKSTPPPQEEEEEGKGSAVPRRSPMHSPTELFLPSTHNLRPRQWQYTSILHKKIQQKAQEKKKSQLSSQRKPTAAPPPLSDVASPPLSRAPNGGQRQNAAVKFSVTEDEEEEKDVYTNSYFLHSSSIVIPRSTRAALRPSTKPRTDAPEEVTPAGVLPTSDPALAGVRVAETKNTEARTQGEDAAQYPTTTQASRVAVAKGDVGNDRSGKREEQALNRMSLLLSMDDSVFTDNGYPLLDAHLSDFYKDNGSSMGMSSDISLSTTIDGSHDRIEPTSTVIDGRRVFQGVGYANKPVSSAAALDHHPSPTKRVSLASAENTKEESMSSMMTIAKHPLVRPRRWAGAMPNSPATRQKLLHEQQRRLLREQQMYVRQLRTSESPLKPFQPPQMPRFLTSTSPHHRLHNAPAPSTPNIVNTLTRWRQQQQQQQRQIPPPLPTPQSRTELASAFFTGEKSQLHVPHCGTTSQAMPQPDIKFGAFVATDKSRNIDFKAALGFGLEDVPAIRSPSWDALPLPAPDENSEEL